MTSDDSSAYGCTHFPSGVKRCLFLDVPFVAAECFRRCAVECALLDELLVTTFLSTLLDADLRPSRIFNSSRQTPVLQAPVLVQRLCLLDLSTRLYDLSDEKGCSARLDWDLSLMPPPELQDSRSGLAVG